MRRRQLLSLAATSLATLMPLSAQADNSSPRIASYYRRHAVLRGGVMHGWVDEGQAQVLAEGVAQVGVSQDAWFALRASGELVTWTARAADARVLMAGVAAFAAGQSGWFAIDPARGLWHGTPGAAAPRKIAQDVAAACIGDSADYYITSDGTLFAHGLAHRGQYGDGLLKATPGFVATAREAVAVRAHTGHAIYLRRDGVVLGTGGNRYGPLGRHGLGDKADRWGPIFEGALAIATGSRHSLALRADGSLWAWGAGFAMDPRKLQDGVLDVAGGDTATIARLADGSIVQWEAGRGPRRVALR